MDAGRLEPSMLAATASGKIPQPGTLFRNVRHAETYERILKEAEAGGGGREAVIRRATQAWSQGFVAAAIDRFCRDNEVMDVTGRRHRGVLTGADMARWQPTFEPPVHFDYKGLRVFKPGPWTQGPVLLQQLALLQGFDLDRLSATDPDFIHLVVECAKLAYADREKFYGDPAFAKVPMETLNSMASCRSEGISCPGFSSPDASCSISARCTPL